MRVLVGLKWLLSHLFVLTMIVVMVNLGFWQLRRLDERQASNAAIVRCRRTAGRRPVGRRPVRIYSMTTQW